MNLITPATSITLPGNEIQGLNYKSIEEVYKTVVATQKNPLAGKPAIFLVSDNIMRQQREKFRAIINIKAQTTKAG